MESNKILKEKHKNEGQRAMPKRQLTKILVVEDEDIVAKDIQNQLKKLRYSVPAVVSSVEEAVQEAEETKPDLVLMDIRLEGDLDGVEAAKQIRARLNVPIVYLTAYADENTLERAKITEPYGYILKPFQIRQLVSTIEMALYKHRMERKLQENEEWLALTLKNIGDGVIAVDTNGLITFINPVAETLTGWSRKDALGKDLGEVFSVVNEGTLAPAENLLTKTLREGVVIGSTESLVPIARDERETHVNVSVAPIRDDKGKNTGAVLVFRETAMRKRSKAKIPELNKEENISIGLMVATSSSLIREGIQKILEPEKNIEIIAEASTCLEIITLTQEKKPDVLLIDTAISNLDVQEILESIREKSAETRTLLLFYTLNEEVITNAIYSGARGYLTAASNAVEFIQAIRAVSKDKIWVEVKTITKILTPLFSLRSNSGFENLTRREKEVVKLVVQGYPNKQISKKLIVSEKTVKTHLNNVFKKLGISQRIQLTSSFL
jgi:PAS domain S-box-containing protein